MNMNFESFLVLFSEKLWSMPFIIFIIISSLILSKIFNFVQLKYFFKGWSFIFKEDDSKKALEENKISTFQAFINALNSSIGNAGFGGMATVLIEGGPGAAFWIFILGFFSMILRFSEVYAGLSFKKKGYENYIGPLSYIKNMPFGNFFVYLYSIFMMAYIFSAGIAAQCNTMGLAVIKTIDISLNKVALIFSLFVFYILFGGSKRIIRFSEIITPIKVGSFFLSIIIILVYHFDKIPDAISLILKSAFSLKSFALGSGVFTMQKAIFSSFSRTLNATEAGTGTASIYFSAANSKENFKTSVTSMITAFISTNLVCGLLILALILTDIKNLNLPSSQFIIEAYRTVFGNFAAPIVTFLSFSFGLGVMVSYSFLGYKIWEFLFGNKSFFIYMILLILTAYFSTLIKVGIIWKSLDLISGSLILINIFALLFNIKKLREIFKKEKI